MELNDNYVWARPGSKAAEKPEVTESPASVEEVQNTVSQSDDKVREAAVVMSDPDSSELSQRDRQTEFFNSMSGVESAEIETNEVYIPTGLLEVPFNDTPHNLGYRIPKMRLAMSKQAKRKMITFTSIFGSIAAVIAAVIVLNSVFGFIPTVKQVPVIYSKNGKAYLTSTSGRFPEQIQFDGNAFQISSNPDRIRFIPNSEDVLVSGDYSTKDDTYSLYLREDMKVSEQGKLIDSGVLGEYEFIFGGKGLLYLKSKGTNDLYMRMFNSDKSIQIERKIECFGTLSDNTAVIITTSGNISIITINKDGVFTAKEVVKSAEALYVDSEATDSFYYIKQEKNTETGERVSNLYRYASNESVKAAVGADRLLAYSCADNWAYYAKSEKVVRYLLDFIDDDCIESDNELISSINGMLFGSEHMAAIGRNQIRKNMSKAAIEYESTAIGYYSHGKSNNLENDCTEVYALDLNGEFISFGKNGAQSGHNANKSGLQSGEKAAIMLETTMVSDSKIKMSEIPYSIVTSNTFYNYAVSIVQTQLFSKSSAVITNGNKYLVDAEKFSNDKVAFSTDYTSFYYIDTSGASADDETDSESDSPSDLDEPTVNINARVATASKSGDLMCIKLTGADTIAQPVAVDVESFTVLSDGSVVYISSDQIAFVGTVAIANRVNKMVVNRSRTAAAILCETVDSGSRLTVYKEGATKVLADSVGNVVFSDDNSLAFIKDFDKVTARGDLYVSRNFGAPTRIDSSVSTIVNYPY